MAGYQSTQIRKPANEVEFEINCVVLSQQLFNDPNAHRLGTSGQAQDGVDIVAHRNGDPNHIVGVQCKVKSDRSKLTAKEVRQEVSKALKYKPALAEYFIVTTSKDDTKLTQLAHALMQEQAVAGRRIQITVWGWNSLRERINQYEAAKQAFDPGFSPSIEEQGRKLDLILTLQKQAATQEQVTELTKRLAASGETTARLPAIYAERELAQSLRRVLRRRNFAGTDIKAELSTLAERAVDGDLSLATDPTRAEVCDRAARVNATTASLEVAQHYRNQAAAIDPKRDLLIVDACLEEAAGDPDGAVRLLRSRLDVDTRSALLTSLWRQNGALAALAWANSAGYGSPDFNSAGAVSLIVMKVDTAQYDDAFLQVERIPANYFDESPILYLIRAQLATSAALPADQKAEVFHGLPLDPRRLQIAAGEASQTKIRRARQDLQSLLALLTELELDRYRSFLSEFELWLRLEDKKTQDEALAQLSAEIADPAKTLQRVRLALAYHTPFNREALKRHLASQKSLGGWTSDERFAAFLITFHSSSLEDQCIFFEEHHDDLFSQTEISTVALASIEVEVFARAGRFKEARHHISLHAGSALTADQAKDLERMVSLVEAGNEVEGLRQRYDETQSVTDLRILVAALHNRRDAVGLAQYAPILARHSRAVEDFDVAIRALFTTEQHAELLALAEDIPAAFASDQDYAALRGWTLYKIGRVKEARDVAAMLLEKRHVSSDRELAINTAIETGDWGRLQAILSREATRLGKLSPPELVRLARLALEAGSPYVDQFRDAALAKAPDDPDINLSAYILETERGTHREEQVFKWFEKAVAKSGPDGPVRAVSLRELSEQMPPWNERIQQVGAQARQAEMPLFVAAKATRRQLVDLTLGQALRNSASTSPSLRYPVFAFSGARSVRKVDIGKAVAFDITALITLQYLGLLEMALALFKRCIIAPATLGMLFLDRQFLKVQQPSEVAKAKRIHDLLADHADILRPSVPAAGTSDVGSELSELIAAARSNGGLVIRSAPVAKVGSLLDETVDMSPHMSVLTDTRSVLRFLSEQGRIDAANQTSAESYLERVDQGWSNAQSISADTTVYLDDLTVTYLDHTRLLEPLARSVGAIIVSENVDRRARDVLRQGQHAETLLGLVEAIRGIVAVGVENGSIQFSRRHREDNSTEDKAGSLLDTAPTLDLLSDLKSIDVVIADDRSLNKVPHWTDSSGNNANTSNTLDVLYTLQSEGEIDDAQYWRARHQLRLAGYYAIPLDAAEVLHHLSRTPTASGTVRQTPELGAIVESLALPLMRSCFQPSEVVWLNGIRLAVHSSLRELWRALARPDAVKAQADWLLSLMPRPLDWCLAPEDESVWAAAIEQTATQVGLLMLFAEGSSDHRKQYYEWLGGQVDALLPPTQPEIWDAMIKFLKVYIERLMEIDDATRTA